MRTRAGRRARAAAEAVGRRPRETGPRLFELPRDRDLKMIPRLDPHCNVFWESEDGMVISFGDPAELVARLVRREEWEGEQGRALDGCKVIMSVPDGCACHLVVKDGAAFALLAAPGRPPEWVNLSGHIA